MSKKKTTCGVASCKTHRINKFAVKVVQLKEELMREGYPETAHAMEIACKAIGWELADKMRRKK